jgi:hypothetical protein
MFWSGMVLTLAPVSHLPLARLAYLKLGLVLYVSTISAAVVVRPRVAAALFWIGVMTAPLNLAFEVLALRRGYWSFAGHYVGWVTVFGATFPVEELVVLVLLSGPAVAANYSLFLESRTIFWRWPGRSHAFPHEASRPPSP